METDKLLQVEVRVINIGLREFALDLERCQAGVVHVGGERPQDQQPPRQARRLT